MEIRNAFDTHSWSDSNTPRILRQDGETLLRHRCLLCGRDFASEMDPPEWRAAYVGVFKIELLTDSVSARWLADECPQRLLPEDDDDRAQRRS